MDRELELAGAASAGGWLRWRKQHAIELGTPCANCETPLQGPYCFNCGQLAESFERNVVHLLVEGFESFFHFDGRFFRTLPNLVIHPGRLTREYLDGKRAYQIPPMRMFLVALLLVFFVGGLNLGGENGGKPCSQRTNCIFDLRTPDQLTPEQKAKLDKTLSDSHVRFGPASAGRASISIDVTNDDDSKAPAPASGAKSSTASGAASATSSSRPATTDDLAKLQPQDATGKWLLDRIKFAGNNQEMFMMVLETWAHRFAILMLPISALFLSILFVFQRRFYVFDHMIFSLHSLSFQGLLLSAYFLSSPWLPFGGLLLLAAPVHLFVHMRGTYQTSVIGTLLRMWILFVSTVVAFAFLVVGLFWVGLSVLKPH